MRRHVRKYARVYMRVRDPVWTSVHLYARTHILTHVCMHANAHWCTHTLVYTCTLLSTCTLPHTCTLLHTSACTGFLLSHSLTCQMYYSLSLLHVVARCISRQVCTHSRFVMSLCSRLLFSLSDHTSTPGGHKANTCGDNLSLSHVVARCMCWNG